MAHEPERVFPEQEHPSDVEIWLQGGHIVVVRVESFGPTARSGPEQACQLGRAFEELAGRAQAGG